MRKCISALLLVALLGSLFVGCAKESPAPTKPPVTYPRQLGEVKSNAVYVETELYIWNDITSRKLYAREIKPQGLAEGEKVPVIIYLHGGNGDATSLLTEPEALAADKIAGFTFECAGGNKVTQKSDGKDIVTAHFSSRITDWLSAYEYVKDLSYVDPERIYLYGQSYGGTTAMFAAPLLNGKIAGAIFESCGVWPDKDYASRDVQEKGIVDEYFPPADWREFLKTYNGDLIFCCAEGDEYNEHENGQRAVDMYNERSQGTAKFYSCPDGAHAFNSFSEEGKQITLNAIREMVLGK